VTESLLNQLESRFILVPARASQILAFRQFLLSLFFLGFCGVLLITKRVSFADHLLEAFRECDMVFLEPL
jgi:hypothetical protein